MKRVIVRTPTTDRYALDVPENATDLNIVAPYVFTFGLTQTENAVRYMSPGGASPWPVGGGTIATSDQFVSVPVAGIVRSLQVQLSIGMASTSGTIVFTVRKRTGGVTSDTSMTVTLSGATHTGTFAYVADTTNTFSVAVGDALSIKVFDSGLSAALQDAVAILRVDPLPGVGVSATGTTSAISMGVFGSSPNSSGGSASGNVLTLQPADATHPGGVSLANQTLGDGIKSFTQRAEFVAGLKVASTESAQFNNSNFSIRYLFSPFDCLCFIGTNYLFDGGMAYFSQTGITTKRFAEFIHNDSTGTPGNATINGMTGFSAFAAAATTVVITNNLATATSKCFWSWTTLDGTLTQMKAVCSAGAITFTGNAAATAVTSFSWFLVE